MYSGYRTIFWGIFLATFHINLGAIQIIPAFVGWFIVAHGIKILYQESNVPLFQKSYRYAFILSLLCIIGPSLSLLRMEHELLIYWPILFAIIELIFIFYLISASNEHFIITNHPLENGDTNILRTYIILFVITTVLETIMFATENSTLVFVVSIATFGMLLWFMYMIHRFKIMCKLWND